MKLHLLFFCFPFTFAFNAQSAETPSYTQTKDEVIVYTNPLLTYNPILQFKTFKINETTKVKI
jgi:hypothetical protein